MRSLFYLFQARPSTVLLNRMDKAMDARFQGEKRMYGPDLHSAKSMTEESLEWKTPAWNTRIVTDFI